MTKDAKYICICVYLCVFMWMISCIFLKDVRQDVVGETQKDFCVLDL